VGIGAAYRFSIIEYTDVPRCAIPTIITTLSTDGIARSSKTAIPFRRTIPGSAAGIA
jgi:hypothetical protein